MRVDSITSDSWCWEERFAGWIFGVYRDKKKENLEHKVYYRAFWQKEDDYSSTVEEAIDKRENGAKS